MSRAGNTPTATSEVEVPALVGLEFEIARARVLRRGLTLGRVERRESSALAPDTVLEQTPAAASKRVAGSAVSVVLAQTPLVHVPAKPSPVPNAKPPTANAVREFRVVHDSPSRLDVALEYSYDGGRGADGILIEACPRVALDLLHKICGRVRIKPGTSRVVLRTDSLPTAPNATSTHVDVCLIYAPTIYAKDNQYFYCEAFPYEKRWGQ